MTSADKDLDLSREAPTSSDFTSASRSKEAPACKYHGMGCIMRGGVRGILSLPAYLPNRFCGQGD